MTFEDDRPRQERPANGRFPADAAEVLDELSRLIDVRLRERAEPVTESEMGGGPRETADRRADRASEQAAAARPRTQPPSRGAGEIEEILAEELRQLRERVRADEEARERAARTAAVEPAAAMEPGGSTTPPAGEGTASPGSGDPKEQPPGTQEATRSRSGMPEALQVLFETSTRAGDYSTGRRAEPGGPQRAEGGQSRYFVRFHRALTRRRGPLPSGLPQRDGLLQGGFGPGLTIVSGRPADSARAFGLNLVWQAVSGERTVLYCPFATGAQALWGEMLVTLSHLTDEEPLVATDLIQPDRAQARLDRIGRLDRVLARTFLPHLALLETVPASPHGPIGFLRQLERELTPPIELLLVDGLPQLEAILGVSHYRERAALLIELDDLLRERGLPGLVLTYPGWSGRRSAEDGLEHLGTTLLRLRSPRRRAQSPDEPMPLVAKVLKQAVTGRQGQIALLYDQSSGLLAEADEQP